MRFFWRILGLLPLLAGLMASQGGVAQTLDGKTIYLPLIAGGAETPQPATGVRVNLPFFNEVIDTQAEFSRMAIFWFGQVQVEANYTDVRIGYSPTELVVMTNTFDKRLWYNPAESGGTLTDWDALTLVLERNGVTTAQQPTTESYRFVVQLRHWQPSASYQAAYRGTGSGWNAQPIAFNALVTPAAGQDGAPNDSGDDRGWSATLRIPFASLGAAAPPADGTLWKLALFVHDRDSQAGPPLPVTAWPQGSSSDSPASWGQIRFGLPAYTSAPSTAPVTTIIREGLDGVNVPDSMVGGGTNCGAGLNDWTQWGEKNYGSAADNNVQNQMNLGDWPCFTKYYLSFPLNTIPTGKVIRSARLVLNHFGGSGEGETNPAPNSSMIQVLAVSGHWDENAINWNNAPAFRENVSVLRVPVLPPNSAPVDREWDVSMGVAQAYQAGQAFEIALYSADGAMHSGKYFRGSEFQDAANRPTLIVEWGSPP